MPTQDGLAVLASELLAALVARLPALGSPVPSRHYVHVGDVAYDCEQLVVTFDRLAKGVPGLELIRPTPGGQPRYTAMSVHLVRCVPTLRESRSAAAAIPNAAELNTLGVQQLTDVLALPVAMREGHDDGSWGVGCDLPAVLEVVGNGPLGGMSGVVMRLAAQV